ncbi:hypothetical protein ROJ8625_03716 [Roseivivax jejudonensis]|uniref:Salt-induced outer membrane protein n=1 Tax=Roseivivax jejudonensis TaxID=1529041 RepID=A0A1X7A6E8_9RHOB|nr:DUF481 domain-containing protein [Roseivivax jejudonensis]SLN71334.1 hypothetical protein ROJ8625_03716 [Roseivivax jejudonensis]
MRTSFLALIAVAGVTLTGPTFAQGAFSNTEVAEDRNEDLRDDIEEDFDRDLDRFGNEGRQLGFDGSLSLRATATDGNTENSDVGLGANLGYFDGRNGYELQLNYTYSEDDGDTTEESLFYDLEYNRTFTDRAYGFAKVQGTVDEFSAYESDTFLGFGLGYRVIDTGRTQWSLQAGPGYRVATLDSALDADFEEEALSASSNFTYNINETTFLTNDTDIISSESDTVVINEIGVNVAMSNRLALRTSLATEYHSDPQPGFEDTDNTLGVSLVYSLN